MRLNDSQLRYIRLTSLKNDRSNLVKIEQDRILTKLGLAISGKVFNKIKLRLWVIVWRTRMELMSIWMRKWHFLFCLVPPASIDSVAARTYVFNFVKKKVLGKVLLAGKIQHNFSCLICGIGLYWLTHTIDKFQENCWKSFWESEIAIEHSLYIDVVCYIAKLITARLTLRRNRKTCRDNDMKVSKLLTAVSTWLGLASRVHPAQNRTTSPNTAILHHPSSSLVH